MRARALEARQGINEFIFAALKMKGRKLHDRSRSLPLTIIGGFLGSGKTTLLNHLLVSPHGRRLVVLVNDFGRINIDAALVASRAEDKIGSLEQGKFADFCILEEDPMEVDSKHIKDIRSQDRSDLHLVSLRTG